MKPILIDELVKNSAENQSQSAVMIKGTKMVGYQIAKPLNYDKGYYPFWERLVGAWKILMCKAIPVQYFVDLTEEEQIEYVKSVIQKNDEKLQEKWEKTLLNLPKKACQSCNGTGTIIGAPFDDNGLNEYECKVCNGTGILPAPPAPPKARIIREGESPLPPPTKK